MANEKISAAPVTLKRGSASDDGESALFTFEQNGENVTIALPVSDIPFLISFASKAANRSAQIKNQNLANKFVIPVEWWEVATTENLETLVFSFQIPGGSELSFGIHPSKGPAISDSIAAALGGANFQKPETPPH